MSQNGKYIPELKEQLKRFPFRPEVNIMPRVGDMFTIAGKYKPRTFWQWLTRKPKELRLYRVMQGGAYGLEVEEKL